MRRFDLRPGEANYAWGRLFEEAWIQGSHSALLVDPYLDKRHQRRNLGEVAQLLHRLGPVTRLSVVTGKRDEMEVAEGDSQLRELATQLEALGIDLSWERDPAQHDRRLLLSNGVVFELGMGLDIYAPTRNLSETNQSLRKIRKATTIRVLAPADEGSKP